MKTDKEQIDSLTADNAQLRKGLETLVNRLEEIHADPHYQSVWSSYQNHGGDYSNGPKYVEQMKAAKALLSLPNPGASLLAERDELKKTVADYIEVLASKDENTRLLDIALNGEEGAAKQASLCDLISNAKSIRFERDAAIKERDEIAQEIDTWINRASFMINEEQKYGGTHEFLAKKNDALEAACAVKDEALRKARDVIFEAEKQFAWNNGAAEPEAEHRANNTPIIQQIDKTLSNTPASPLLEELAEGRKDTERLNFIEHATNQLNLWGTFIMGGSNKSVRAAIDSASSPVAEEGR